MDYRKKAYNKVANEWEGYTPEEREPMQVIGSTLISALWEGRLYKLECKMIANFKGDFIKHLYDKLGTLEPTERGKVFNELA